MNDEKHSDVLETASGLVLVINERVHIGLAPIGDPPKEPLEKSDDAPQDESPAIAWKVH